MSCRDYQNDEDGCCNMSNEKRTECLSSKSGFHCWHNPITYNNGYTLTVAYYPAQEPDPTCCFCGVKESQLHGPYHPNNTPKWNQQSPYQWGGITGGAITLGNNTGSFGTLWTGSQQTTITFATGSGYTWTANPYANTSTGGFLTSGYAKVVGCTNSPGSASFGSCPVGCPGHLVYSKCNGTTTGCNVAGCLVCTKGHSTL